MRERLILTRVSYNGNTSAFQADAAGSIPATRSTTCMFYVYVLKSQKDDNLYFGYSTDLKKRFAEHNQGKVDSTRSRRPLDLVYYEAYKSENDAK